jgi:hypothetical protein
LVALRATKDLSETARRIAWRFAFVGKNAPATARIAKSGTFRQAMSGAAGKNPASTDPTTGGRPTLFSEKIPLAGNSILFLRREPE